MYWMMNKIGSHPDIHREEAGDQTSGLRPLTSGIYNPGTGKARTFNDLANATFAGTGKQPVIEYIDIPEDIRDKYQYFTEADMTKLRKVGYSKEFYTLEEGVGDYVKNFLTRKKYY